MKYVLALLMFLGLFHAVHISRVASEVPKTAEPVAKPAQVDVSEKFIAGSGLIEPRSELIDIASPIAGLVTDVFVEIGQNVKAGDALFEIDSRSRRAELASAESAVQVASAQLDDAQRLFDIVQTLRAKDLQAVSREQFETRRGALEIAKAQLQKARSDKDFIQAELDRLTVRAPINGQVLQRRIRAGEYAIIPQGSSGTDALLILGDVENLHVRVDVDENDAWRFVVGSKAEGFIRGNPQLKLGLEFVRVEPYVIPKRSLNGGTTERVDTRVLQIIYQITSYQTLPYVGQLVDVYIASN